MVLQSFKNLHRARKSVFQGDEFALRAAQTRINEEYRKYKHVEDAAVIEELLKFAEAVEIELKASVVQAREVQPGTYELRITAETRKLDNVPFSECKR
ncbi:complex III assembly factor LYRM7 isoform X2 [Anabrus simplex]|uniref:complex III assembly factor LYRM7 isoform X2 n=1 Tax=Anabrus simplex TaxID=316456 RepID=UPI0034DD101D